MIEYKADPTTLPFSDAGDTRWSSTAAIACRAQFIRDTSHVVSLRSFLLMTLGHQPDEVPEENLYAAPAVTDQAAATTDSAKPMTAASGISVILAVLVSGPVFVATFWVTCLGLEIDNRFVSLMALATSVVAVILVYKCILAIGRIFDNT